MSAKHTPGPWLAEGPYENTAGGYSLAIGGSLKGIDLTVATVAFNGDEDKEACWADAYLISAAPDLLMELQEIHRIFCRLMCTPAAHIPQTEEHHCDRCRSARFAMTKARGGK